MTLQPGQIFVPVGSPAQAGQPRVVVTGIDARGNVFYHGLAHCGGGGICHGTDSTRLFLQEWEYVATMTWSGAWKRARRYEVRLQRLRYWTKHIASLAERAPRLP